MERELTSTKKICRRCDKAISAEEFAENLGLCDDCEEVMELEREHRDYDEY